MRSGPPGFTWYFPVKNRIILITNPETIINIGKSMTGKDDWESSEP